MTGFWLLLKIEATSPSQSVMPFFTSTKNRMTSHSCVAINTCLRISSSNTSSVLTTHPPVSTTEKVFPHHSTFPYCLSRVVPASSLTIAVVRVEKVTDVVEESINFATEKKNDSSILKGKQNVVTAGKKGTVERTYEIVKENGKEITKTLVSENVISKPTTEVIAVGTKVVVASVSRSSSSASSGAKEFYVTATAYTPNCSGCSGISATGINLHSSSDLKLIAVDPSVIPLGSKVWVEGYGYAIAGDTGGAIKGNKIDCVRS